VQPSSQPEFKGLQVLYVPYYKSVYYLVSMVGVIRLINSRSKVPVERQRYVHRFTQCLSVGGSLKFMTVFRSTLVLRV